MLTGVMDSVNGKFWLVATTGLGRDGRGGRGRGRQRLRERDERRRQAIDRLRSRVSGAETGIVTDPMYTVRRLPVARVTEPRACCSPCRRRRRSIDRCRRRARARH